jgi:hypothetical protein
VTSDRELKFVLARKELVELGRYGENALGMRNNYTAP